MLVRIKSWDEAVKAALAADENWHVKGNSIFGILDKRGEWGKVIEGRKDSRYFYSVTDFTYPLCLVDEIIEDSDGSVNSDDILRYGEIITDDQIYNPNIRIRLISYDGMIWYHKMHGGDVVECRKVGRGDA